MLISDHWLRSDRICPCPLMKIPCLWAAAGRGHGNHKMWRRFNYVYCCLLLFIIVYWCLLMFIDVYWCLLDYDWSLGNIFYLLTESTKLGLGIEKLETCKPRYRDVSGTCSTFAFEYGSFLACTRVTHTHTISKHWVFGCLKIYRILPTSS